MPDTRSKLLQASCAPHSNSRCRQLRLPNSV
jgi:hypothetical protein